MFLPVQIRARRPRGPLPMLLGQVVRALEGMPDAQRLRWLDLLSYVHALVYRERAPAERADM